MRSARWRQVERISEQEARHAELLAALPQALQEQYQRRQREAAPNEAALRWSFPPVILDEAAFRAEHAGGGGAGSSDESD